MARLLIAILLASGLASTLSAQAQGPVTSLESLAVEIWPDYDRPAVLVLLTGTLPGDAATETTVTVPIPAEATINAVARINPQGAMFDDIPFDDDTPNQLTLTTPDSRFRIEYYVPYVSEDDGRSFTFSWRANLTVDRLEATVQQPALATDFTVSPPAASVTAGRDSLQYHNLAPQAVLAGESFTIEVDYSMVGTQLSAEVVDSQPAEAPEAGTAPEGSAGTSATSFDWPVAVAAMGGVLVVAATAWFLVSRRSTSARVTKPRPVRRLSSKRASQSAGQRQPSLPKFCHECGQAVEPGDRFCRDCGTALKGVR